MNLKDLNEDNTPWLSFENQFVHCKVIQVYDGDSITVILPFESLSSYYKVKCRLYGIYTPEIRTRDLEEKTLGFSARDYLREQVLDKIVWIKCGKWDKYGRLLITIYQELGSEISLNEQLVELGYAEEYFGGKR